MITLYLIFTINLHNRSLTCITPAVIHNANKNYIDLSMGQRIIYTVSEKKEQHLTKLKSCLIQWGQPEDVLDGTMTKPFSPSFKSQTELTDYIDFVYNKNIINNSLNDFHDNSLKNVFQNKKPLLATCHAKLLQNVLIRTRFGLVSTPRASPKNTGLYNCQDKRCRLHYRNYVTTCKEFKFKLKSGRCHTWKYNRL